MAVPMVVTLDGTSRGLTLHKTQLTLSNVLEERKAEVLKLSKQPIFLLSDMALSRNSPTHLQNETLVKSFFILITVGNATRLCMMDGNWADPDVLECESQQFLQILLQVTSTILYKHDCHSF